MPTTTANVFRPSFLQSFRKGMLSIAVAFAALSTGAQAANPVYSAYTATGTSNNWTDPSNWVYDPTGNNEQGGVPGSVNGIAGDVAQFDTATTGTNAAARMTVNLNANEGLLDLFFLNNAYNGTTGYTINPSNGSAFSFGAGGSLGIDGNFTGSNVVENVNPTIILTATATASTTGLVTTAVNAGQMYYSNFSAAAAHDYLQLGTLSGTSVLTSNGNGTLSTTGLPNVVAYASNINFVGLSGGTVYDSIIDGAAITGTNLGTTVTVTFRGLSGTIGTASAASGQAAFANSGTGSVWDLANNNRYSGGTNLLDAAVILDFSTALSGTESRLGTGGLAIGAQNLGPVTAAGTSTGGGVLEINGSSTFSSVQKVSALTIGGNQGDASTLIINSNGQATGLLDTGAITRNPGDVLDVEFTGSTALDSFVTNSNQTGSFLLNNGIMTGVTFGNNNFATYTASTGAITAYAGAYTATPGAANQVDANGAVALTGAAANSLRFNSTAATTATVTGTATITSGQILVTSAVGANADSIQGGTLASGTNNEIIIYQNDTAAPFTVSSLVTGSTALTKAGAGTLILAPTGSNNYSGVTDIDSGLVQAGSAGAFSSSSAVNFSGSTAGLDLNGFNFTLNSIATNAVSGYASNNLALAGEVPYITNSKAGTESILTLSSNSTFNGAFLSSPGATIGLKLNGGTFSLSYSGVAYTGGPQLSDGNVGSSFIYGITASGANSVNADYGGTNGQVDLFAPIILSGGSIGLGGNQSTLHTAGVFEISNSNSQINLLNNSLSAGYLIATVAPSASGSQFFTNGGGTFGEFILDHNGSIVDNASNANDGAATIVTAGTGSVSFGAVDPTEGVNSNGTTLIAGGLSTLTTLGEILNPAASGANGYDVFGLQTVGMGTLVVTGTNAMAPTYGGAVLGIGGTSRGLGGIVIGGGTLDVAPSGANTTSTTYVAGLTGTGTTSQSNSYVVTYNGGGALELNRGGNSNLVVELGSNGGYIPTNAPSLLARGGNSSGTLIIQPTDGFAGLGTTERLTLDSPLPSSGDSPATDQSAGRTTLVLTSVAGLAVNDQIWSGLAVGSGTLLNITAINAATNTITLSGATTATASAYDVNNNPTVLPIINPQAEFVTNGIISPTIVAQDTNGKGDFVTYVGTGTNTDAGVVEVTAANDPTYSTSLGATTGPDVVELLGTTGTNATVLTGTAAAYALRDDGRVSLSGSATLLLGGFVNYGSAYSEGNFGGLILNGGVISGGTLKTASNVELTIYTSPDTTATGAGVVGAGGGTISSNIIGSEGLTKFGPGTLYLTGTNSSGVLTSGYTGTTTIDGGTLDVGNLVGTNSGLGSASLALVGGVLQATGTGSSTFVRAVGTGANQVNWGDNGNDNYTGQTVSNASAGGFSAGKGEFDVALGGTSTANLATPLVWGGTANFVPEIGSLLFGSDTSGGLLNFENSISLTSNSQIYQADRIISVTANANDNIPAAVATGLGSPTANGSPVGIADFTKLSGTISGNSFFELVKAGNGILNLTGTNTYTGATVINNGVLEISSDSNLGAAPTAAYALALTPDGTTTGATVTPGTLQVDGGTLWTTASFALNSNRTVLLGPTANFDVAPATTLTVGGVVSDYINEHGALTKTDSGTLVLSGSNSYTGGTNINGGVLQAASVNALASSGAISFNGGTTQGGTLQYTAASAPNDYSGRFSSTGAQAYKIDTNGQNVNYASSFGNGSSTFTRTGGTGVLNFTGGTDTFGGANGTTLNAGTTYVNNSVSTTQVNTATGTTVGGTGTITTTTGTGIVLGAGSTLISGGIQAGPTGTNATGGNTATTTAGLKLIPTIASGSNALDASQGTVIAPVTLTFYLGTGTDSSSKMAYTFANPDMNSSFMTVTGDSVNELKFNLTPGATVINVQDLSGGNLSQLYFNEPYLLIAAGADSDYSGILTTGGLDQAGYVTNLTLTGLPASYVNPRLYLAANGDLEVVPEPGTWALMLGGLGVLFFIQSRRRQSVGASKRA